MAILAHAPVIRSGGHQRTVVAGHLPDHRAEQALRPEQSSLLLDRPRVVKRPPLATWAGVAVRRDGLFVVVDRQVRERGYQVAGVAGAVGLPRVVAAGTVEVVALDVREVLVVEDAGVAVLGGDVHPTAILAGSAGQVALMYMSIQDRTNFSLDAAVRAASEKNFE